MARVLNKFVVAFISCLRRELFVLQKQRIISVIIPCFKVENYLNKCVKSLVNQRYSNLEIILVDDGSPDDCAMMCDDWAEKDDRIKVIHKQNGGLSDARNFGTRIVCGEYISYIDSDDYVSIDFYDLISKTAIEHASDIVECSVAKFYENGDYEEYHDDLKVIDYSTAEGLSALINERPFHQHVWNKLYKADIVKGINFEVGKLNEDEFWTYQVFGQAKRITKINRTMYFYFQRESSIMGQNYSLHRLNALEGKWNRQQYIEKNYPELTTQAKIDFFGSCMYAMQCVIRYMVGEERKQAFGIIMNYKKRCRLTFRDIKSMCGGIKKYFYLAKINMYLCCKLRVLRGIE